MAFNKNPVLFVSSIAKTKLNLPPISSKASYFTIPYLFKDIFCIFSSFSTFSAFNCNSTASFSIKSNFLLKSFSSDCPSFPFMKIAYLLLSRLSPKDKLNTHTNSITTTTKSISNIIPE